jgi:hypothetical protein
LLKHLVGYLRKGLKLSNEILNEYIVFTVTNLAYLPKALVLAESLFNHDDVKLKIYIIDRKVDVDLPTQFAEFIWIEDAGVNEFYELAFKYDITELSTSLKPGISLDLLKTYPKVIFLDPDTCLYHSIAPILKDLDDHSIVLTPHYTIPHSNTLADSDIGMMRFGSFNLGFFAVKNSEQGLYFLNWWDDRCRRFGYFETQFGLSTDQKWVSIAPCFFQDLYVSFNLGYNVAFWNLQERKISKVNNNYIVNDKYALIFFHFSSFDDVNPELLSKRTFNRSEHINESVIELSRIYSDAQLKWKKLVPMIKYGFDYMSNGDYISPTLRRAYACMINELPSHENPFDANGVVGSFAKRNYLICKNNKTYSPESSGDMSSYRKSFFIVNFVMRILLRLLGPNKFSNFSRLLVYLSSYRQNRGLWKI